MSKWICAASCALTLAITAPAFGQEARLPPVLNALAERATLPSSGAFDLAGVRLGSTPAEVSAALKALSPNAAVKDVNEVELTISDNRGNRFGFLYPNTLVHSFNHGDGASEHVEVLFTTNVNETRAAAIERRIAYPGSAQQGSLPELIAGLRAKYGEPTVRVGGIGMVEYHWVWFGGQRIRMTEAEAANNRNRPGTPSVCMLGLPLGAYRYNMERRQQGCDVSLGVKIHLGARDDLVANVTFLMTDFKRVFQNANETDAWLRAEIDKLAAGRTGTTPRL